MLAKHDEKYMPKEVVDALKKQGHWKRAPGNEMIAEIGHYALVLALGLALIQSVVPTVGARRATTRDGRCRADGAGAVRLVAVAFAALTACYVTSDFSVANVFENSHSAMPLVYKFTSVWGNTRARCCSGSSSCRCSARAGGGVRGQPAGYAQGQCPWRQAWIASTFYLFILAHSNPVPAAG